MVDLWQIRNTDKKQSTWRHKRPLIQRHLDYCLISGSLQDSDHSAITLQINSIEDQVRGPSHWCFNSSLLNDENYVELITAKYGEWIQEFADVQDKRLLWDLIKIIFSFLPLIVSMSYRKHGFRFLTEGCFKQTATKYVDTSIKLSPYRQFCCPVSLMCTSPSANIPVSPRFFGEFDGVVT